jgi:sugar phosphate isomerase/epimerase
VQLCLRSEPAAGVSLDVLIRTAAEAGYACLDVAADTLGDQLAHLPLASLDARLREQGTYIAVVGGLRPLTIAPRVEALVSRAQLLDICTYIDALGGGVITLTPGPQPESTRPGGDHTAWIVSALRTFSDLAAPFEARLALEYGAHERGIVRSLAHCQEIIHRVARSNVGLSLNARTLSWDDEAIEQLGALHLDVLWLVRLAEVEDGCAQATESQPCTPIAGCAFSERELCLRLSTRGFLGLYSVPLLPGKRPLAEAARAARLATLRWTQGLPSG